jgi:formylglycine-generating enzyme required for sulfatase activity
MGHQGFAAQSMTYASAAKFCEWLSKKTGKKYRLPTETEWAWAARAGGKDPEKPANLQAIAWYWDNADDKTQPVATKNPNALGIHDMLGNVWEWTTATGGGGVVRGGSYRDKATNVHVGARAVYSPSWQTTDPQNPKSKWWLSDAPFIGFRVVCEG